MTGTALLRIARYVPALFAIGLLAGSLVACATADSKVQSRPGTTTTIILTRHAERTQVTKVLTAKGQQRARDLVGAVDGLEVAAIYSPDLERNLDTVRPLAKHLGIEISVQPASSTPLVDQIVDDMPEKPSCGSVTSITCAQCTGALAGTGKARSGTATCSS